MFLLYLHEMQFANPDFMESISDVVDEVIQNCPIDVRRPLYKVGAARPGGCPGLLPPSMAQRPRDRPRTSACRRPRVPSCARGLAQGQCGGRGGLPECGGLKRLQGGLGELDVLTHLLCPTLSRQLGFKSGHADCTLAGEIHMVCPHAPHWSGRCPHRAVGCAGTWPGTAQGKHSPRGSSPNSFLKLENLLTRVTIGREGQCWRSDVGSRKARPGSRPSPSAHRCQGRGAPGTQPGLGLSTEPASLSSPRRRRRVPECGGSGSGRRDRYGLSSLRWSTLQPLK